MFIPVCVFCFLFVLSSLVWFFLWLPQGLLILLFFLHCENGDFSILMKDILSDFGENRMPGFSFFVPLFLYGLMTCCFAGCFEVYRGRSGTRIHSCKCTGADRYGAEDLQAHFETGGAS